MTVTDSIRRGCWLLWILVVVAGCRDGAVAPRPEGAPPATAERPAPTPSRAQPEPAPEPEPAPAPDPGRPTLVVSILASGQAVLGAAVVDDDQLEQRLREAVAADPELPLLVRADRNVAYKRVIEVMDRARAAGVSRLSMSSD